MEFFYGSDFQGLVELVAISSGFVILMANLVASLWLGKIIIKLWEELICNFVETLDKLLKKSTDELDKLSYKESVKYHESRKTRAQMARKSGLS